MCHRPDRDEHIRIQWDNIPEWAYYQYRKQDDSLTFNVSYDGLSLMHYNAFEGFGIDKNKPTMESRVSCYRNSLTEFIPSIFRWNQSMIIFYEILFWNLNHLGRIPKNLDGTIPSKN